jgi:hypothetical protein
MQNNKALKYDEDKPGLDLLPVEAKKAIAEVFDFGAKKYARHNWRSGFDWSRLIRASQGHIDAFNDGEDLDKESGKSHLAHAGCCILMLLESTIKGFGTDNRYTTEAKNKFPQDIDKLLKFDYHGGTITMKEEIKRASNQAAELSEAGKKIEKQHSKSWVERTAEKNNKCV